MCHKRLHHMMMPAQPTTRLIMIHPDFTFGLFESGFDRPAETGHLRQIASFAIEWRVAQMKLQLARLGETATQNGPDARAWQTVAHGGDTQASKLCPQWAFAPFFDEVTSPGTAWQVGTQRSQFTRVRGVARDARMNARPAQWATARWFNRRRSHPDTRVTRHFGKVPFAQVRGAV